MKLQAPLTLLFPPKHCLAERRMVRSFHYQDQSESPEGLRVGLISPFMGWIQAVKVCEICIHIDFRAISSQKLHSIETIVREQGSNLLNEYIVEIFEALRLDFLLSLYQS